MELEPEGKHIEYKAAATEIPKDLWETYSAFANTKGGIITLGVSEKKKRRLEVTGVTNPEKRVEEFWKLVTNPSKVSANLLQESDVEIKNLNGKKVIDINVPEAQYSQKPIYIKGHKEECYKRIGEEDKKATEEEYRYMVVNSHDDIDNILIDGYWIDDLNTKDVLHYKHLLIENTSNEKYLDMSNEDFLKEIGVLKKDRQSSNNVYKLTIGGLLFFGKYNSIIDYYPHFQLDYFRKKTTVSTDWIDRISSGDMDYPELNVYSFYLRVIEKLTQSIESKFELTSDLTRESFLSDMSVALREALINSLMHAYYASPEPIKITAYDDYYEFFNPGDMRVSKEEFIHGGTSRVRNSTISILFRRNGYAERAGSGGPRIFDTVIKHKLREPEIISTDKSTTIRIWKTDVMGFFKDRDKNEQLIIKYILNKGSITKSYALNQLKLSEYAFRTALKNLLKDKIIEKHGNGRNTFYIIVNSHEAKILSNKKMLTLFQDVFTGRSED